MDILCPALVREMALHALSAPGLEVCGLVYPDRYVPLPNVSPAPGLSFEAGPRALAAALFRYGEPAAVFHTHPGGDAEPSAADFLSYYYNSITIIGIWKSGRLSLIPHSEFHIPLS